jgi:hypothetical protein
MSIIHGSRGLIYFVHQFKPIFREASLLDDPELLGAVTKLNHEIAELAPVLNAGTPSAKVTVISENAAVPVATLALDHDGSTHVFAVAMRDGKTKASFALAGRSGDETVEVLHEGRVLPASAGKFSDDFDSWGVHIYRVAASQKR